MEYCAYMDQRIVGSAWIEPEGLYWVIRCSCRDLSSGIFRLHMMFADKTIDLGVLIREEGYFKTKRKIPQKSTGVGEPVFFVIPAGESYSEWGMHISKDHPIENIEVIRSSRLLIRNDEMYIIS